jgi:hypothetical protein
MDFDRIDSQSIRPQRGALRSGRTWPFKNNVGTSNTESPCGARPPARKRPRPTQNVRMRLLDFAGRYELSIFGKSLIRTR